jgi:hypothetical protein
MIKRDPYSRAGAKSSNVVESNEDKILGSFTSNIINYGVKRFTQVKLI